MRKVLLTMSLIALLSGCISSDIDLVKGGTMDFNQTITLGQALDTWKSCVQREWGEFKTDNGVRVVAFKCTHKISGYIHKAKSYLSEKEQEKNDHLNVSSNIQTFQFTINQNDTFQIDNVQAVTVWADGKSFKVSQKPVEQLQTAYNNELNFDPSEINEIAVGKISYVFSMIKAEAK